MIEPLHIRPTTAADMTEITAIFAHEVRCGTATFETTPPNASEMTTRWQDMTRDGYPHFVAVQDDRVVGYTYASAHRPRPAYRFTVENSVYVAQDRQEQGVGTALLRHLILTCEAGPWRQMIAVIGGADNSGSLSLHRAQGFETVGTLKAVGHKFGQWVDTVILQRPL